VTTVVSKLFNIVEPDVAFFGQKDAAQVAIIRRMVRDLNIPVEIAVCPIVREADGLAMSSRNAYLNPEQRKQALVLYRSLMRVQTLADRGESSSARLKVAGEQVMAEEPVELDYFEIVNRETLDPVSDISGGALVAGGFWGAGGGVGVVTGGRTTGGTVTGGRAAEGDLLGTVPPTVFVPRPNVDSSLVGLRRRSAPPVSVPSVNELFTLVRSGFSQRRKMLRSALRPVLGTHATDVLVAAGIAPTARAESLGLEQWAALARSAAAAA